ncbi:uncharacterized protein [Mytilus edulis]|uniref:uncharacterized protein n=1 Tax=Mytilus edulis TaxID=6550 RepID=UPI0039EEC824
MMTYLTAVLSLLYIVLTGMVCTEEQDHYKRLLLNDPDVINSRLINLEKSMQDVVRLTQQQQTMQSTIAQLQNALLNDRGSTYIRWGRKQCSGVNTEMLYTGFAAGQKYHHIQYYGGPANMLCLPNNPEISNRTAPGSSLLVGTEYRDGNFFVTGANTEDVPCALCRSANTSSSIMIPGRESCDSGWKIEYNGILASGSYSHKPSSYLCLDSHPEFLQAGQDNKDGHLLYATRTKCGSLACPPYVDNMAINCVVCSK